MLEQEALIYKVSRSYELTDPNHQAISDNSYKKDPTPKIEFTQNVAFRRNCFRTIVPIIECITSRYGASDIWIKFDFKSITT